MIYDSPVNGISYRQRRDSIGFPYRNGKINSSIVHLATDRHQHRLRRRLNTNLHNTFSFALKLLPSITLKCNQKSSNSTPPKPAQRRSSAAQQCNITTTTDSIIHSVYLVLPTAARLWRHLAVRNNANESTKGTCKINFIPKRSPIRVENEELLPGVSSIYHPASPR